MLSAILKANGHDLAFNVLDIGALPLEGETEPYHQLLAAFPSSRLSGFELDARLCAELNSKCAAGVRYYSCALGKTEEKRALYNTAHPMCTSLYRPDERYADLFGKLDVMRLQHTSEITTTSLDRFIVDNEIGPVDFIKIDVQGAELDIFEGGTRTLHDALFVVSEVEFVPLYEGQPLFGDLSTWMRSRGMMFHKFLGMAGRVMKPLTAHGSGVYPVQFMWSDAVFVRDLFALKALESQQLLKLAVLLDLYESNDVALHALRCYDAATGDDLADIYLRDLTKSGPWQLVGNAQPQTSAR